jgi:hypothetical protein
MAEIELVTVPGGGGEGRLGAGALGPTHARTVAGECELRQ